MRRVVSFLLLLVVTFSMCACSLGKNETPKETVKDFLDRYKNQDSEVLDNLDEIISSEYKGEYKDRYKTLMINQYKNMDYKITDEIVDGNSAIVTVDITVYNYSSAIDEANDYLSKNEKEFMKESEDETTSDYTNIDNDKFIDYKLSLLEKVSDKKTYSIEFSLNKEDDKWKLDSLSDSDIEKIHGIYSE